jgi:hypothetical protein
MPKGELEKNCRKPRDLVKNRHSASLKKGELILFQGEMKKGEDIADDDDVNQCVTRLSDSDTVYGGIVPQDSVSIALSTFQTGKKCRGGRDTDEQHDTFSSPSCVSHLPSEPLSDLQGF